ncbi:MAG: mechanosensitive ion channel family protein, partial [Actinomycetota bacterium]|nr:mechanosensitive ion channel family protein [Actinomycetota bacterium]
RTEPGRQWEVGREINLRIKKTFDRAGVEIPFPHRTLYFGGDAHDPKGSAPNADALRQIIREELAALTGAGTDADLVSQPKGDE